MNFSVVIPARYASTRLPAKPLADIAGLTMIQRVYEQASLSDAQRVIVATDHPEIEAAVKRFGGEVCITREDHASGTDRLQEVVTALSLNDDELVSEMISEVDTYLDPNAVKVVKSEQGMALYFSRAPLPWNRDLLTDKENSQTELEAFLQTGAVQKHLGIYAYRVSLLNEFVTWPLSNLENIEKLEQLRVLANGHQIHVQTAVEPVPGGVDTQADLEKVNAYFQELNS